MRSPNPLRPQIASTHEKGLDRHTSRLDVRSARHTDRAARLRVRLQLGTPPPSVDQDPPGENPDQGRRLAPLACRTPSLLSSDEQAGWCPGVAKVTLSASQRMRSARS
jgi:hypothetical protein